MYQRITDEDPYKVPMRIYPAVHYTMGGLWVDYNLMSNVPGLFVLGEANFSDHGANRLGASALMQGLADGYFVIPYTLGHYLGEHVAPSRSRPTTTPSARPRPPSQARIDRLLAVKGKRTIRDFHRAARRRALGRRRHVAHRRRACSEALERDPRRCATSSGRTSRCPARRTT